MAGFGDFMMGALDVLGNVAKAMDEGNQEHKRKREAAYGAFLTGLNTLLDFSDTERVVRFLDEKIEDMDEDDDTAAVRRVLRVLKEELEKK